jgi:hypothetical protein
MKIINGTGISKRRAFMLFRVALVILSGLAIVGASVAKDARIGSANLTLPPPVGFCELTDQQSSDAKVLKVLRGVSSTNEILVMSADCSQLEAFRAGKQRLLDDFAQYQTPVSSKDSSIPRAERSKRIAETCAELRAEGEKLTAGLAADVNTRLETVAKAIKINENRFLGVLAEDDNTCYFALLQKLQTEAGTEKTQAVISAVTVLEGKYVFYYLYTVYQSAETVTAALARHQRNVKALLAANGG